ncbi:MAG: M23 family metallopeptidase [Candidatus Aminicenantes bacterium]|nr:M23 family metallopeptidase [Candidatus Aminicenantes bacterium]
MKKGLVFLTLLAGLSAAEIVLPSEKALFQVPSGASLELEFRSLQPGEVLLVSLPDPAGVRRAVVVFRDREYVLTSALRFAFVGLDLGLEPGSFPMTVTFERTNGGRESVRRDIVVEAKEFPRKKLWVKENFALPPKEVEERIRREAELVAWVYGIITPRWLGDGAFFQPNEGKVFPNFGQRRIYNDAPRSTHTGVDIAAPQGDPIRAANAGKVVLASHLYLSGNAVIIDHGLGVFSFYGHMSKILVKRGQAVGKGDVIGKCGTTGRSTGPHLHWAVRVFDSRVDPFSLFSFESPSFNNKELSR